MRAALCGFLLRSDAGSAVTHALYPRECVCLQDVCMPDWLKSKPTNVAGPRRAWKLLPLTWILLFPVCALIWDRLRASGKHTQPNIRQLHLWSHTHERSRTRMHRHMQAGFALTCTGRTWTLLSLSTHHAAIVNVDVITRLHTGVRLHNMWGFLSVETLYIFMVSI